MTRKTNRINLPEFSALILDLDSLVIDSEPTCACLGMAGNSGQLISTTLKGRNYGFCSLVIGYQPLQAAITYLTKNNKILR